MQHNVQGLREVLFEAIEKLRDGSEQPSVANAKCNLAGKILKTAEIELKYCEKLGVETNILFFNGKDGKKSISEPKDKKECPLLVDAEKG